MRRNGRSLACTALRAGRRILRTAQHNSSRAFCAESEARVVPEVVEMLKQVKMEEHADKFASLHEFMTAETKTLKIEKQVDSVKHRKLILRQAEFASQLHRMGLLEETVVAVEEANTEEEAETGNDGVDEAGQNNTNADDDAQR